MLSLKKILKNELKSAKKLAILGVGSDLRGDDAAGMIVVDKLSGYRPKVSRLKHKIFVGATVPENLTGQIKKFKPTHLLIVDCAELNKRPGSVRIIEKKELEGVSFSTHKLPLKVMVDYLSQSIDCITIIIGIQPKHTGFGNSLSKQVEKAANEIYQAIKEIL